jgi:hypothetical protein
MISGATPAFHWGVERSHPIGFKDTGNTSCRQRRDGAHVDEEHPFTHALAQALSPDDDGFDIWAIGQHRHHHIALLSHLSW